MFSLTGVNRELVANSFKTLEREMRFGRGFVSVDTNDNGDVVITVCAKDLTSLRSLVNGVLKSLYLIFKVEELG
ncbi:KEOPS complex subunit Pcc1 [Vulcanisaeta sp. JCM 14467]|uniref:KEOPS complex subunit Pcc1 n=1 Tax=Vulcanisaeta sp. JCM 14467 TaxID=1295370 RepID=UPI000A80AC7C|nr:KEOPS complex subunit Pcc1 [Vulcanisaeta sp. JCM 14467]